MCKLRKYLLAVVSPSGIRKKLHSRNDPDVVHVNSSKPPLHTGATPGGVITTPIIITSLSLCYYGQFIIQNVTIPAVVSLICRSKTLARHTEFNDSDGFMTRLSVLSSKIFLFIDTVFLLDTVFLFRHSVSTKASDLGEFLIGRDTRSTTGKIDDLYQ